jgi:serine protease inhibitor
MKKNIITTVLVLLSIPLLFIKCSKTPDEILPEDPVVIELTANQVAMIKSENSFAFDIFREIAENEESRKNIIISPLSISYALSMTLNGADGTTREAMLTALRMSGITPEEINTSYKNLTEALLTVDKRVLMTIANSVWTEDDFAVKQAFIDILTDYYDAESKEFDINDTTVPEQVNTWIEDKTNGLIKDMISELPDNTVMLLINAIYFKGKWKFRFEENETLDQPFYLPSGSSSDVPTMIQNGDFKVYDGDGFMMGEFPYGQGNFVMDIILPDDNDGLEALLPSITDAAFTGWVNHLSEKEVDVWMPRFKYEFKTSLVDMLTDMGMGIAFSDAADFSNISDFAQLTITDILHQAFIETNEEGTEAAAATVVIIGITSAGPTAIEFRADHPFIYIIRETTTNSIIFMGRVADPLAE